MWGQNQGFGGQGTPSQHFGGHGGSQIDFSQNPNLSLVAVRGRCGASIDAVQFLFVDINSGQYVESPRCGGGGGQQFMYQAPPGQYINAMWIEANQFIQALKFYTNGGLQSSHYGGGVPGGQHHYKSGGRITGVKMRGGAIIDGLQFFAGQ